MQAICWYGIEFNYKCYKILMSCAFQCRHEQMSTTSDLSSGSLLCRCGVHARVRNSWTETNPGSMDVLTIR
jgi:hypothetical protein